MIVRFTNKLSKRIKVVTTETLPIAEDPLHDWLVYDFKRGRDNYMLLANTASLYCEIVPLAGVALAKKLEVTPPHQPRSIVPQGECRSDI